MYSFFLFLLCFDLKSDFMYNCYTDYRTDKALLARYNWGRSNVMLKITTRELGLTIFYLGFGMKKKEEKKERKKERKKKNSDASLTKTYI